MPRQDIGPELSRATCTPWGRIVADKIRAGNCVSIEPDDNLQDALDAIPAGVDQFSPQVIFLMPGIYRAKAGKSPTVQSFIVSKSNTALVGFDRNTTILYDDINGGTAGTLLVSGTGLSNVTIANLRSVTIRGGAPHPAFDTGQDCDNLRIVNCIIDGAHDAIQFRFTNANQIGKRVFMQGCLILCSHDAVTFKSTGRYFLSGNSIYVNSPGGSEYTVNNPNVVTQKSTGYHYNANQAVADPSDLIQISDNIVSVYGSTDIPSAGDTSSVVAAFYVYNVTAPGGSVGKQVARTLITNPNWYVECNFDQNTRPAGLLVNGNLKNADGDFRISGGKIMVRQLAGTMVSNVDPAAVDIINNPTDATAFYARLAGTTLHAYNAAGGTPRSIRTSASGKGFVKADCYGDEPILDGAPVTVSALAHKP